MSILENIKLFFVGALDFNNMSSSHLSAAYEDSLEEFFLLAFSDLIGIDFPGNYYAIELYPYLAEELMRWQIYSTTRKSVWEDKGSKLDFDY